MKPGDVVRFKAGSEPANVHPDPLTWVGVVQSLQEAAATVQWSHRKKAVLISIDMLEVVIAAEDRQGGPL